MDREKVAVKYRGLMDKYLREFSGILMVVTDGFLEIQEANGGFLNLLNLSDSPVGKGFKEYLMEESYRDLTLPYPGEWVKSFLSFKNPGILSPAANYTFNCHVYNYEGDFIFFGEKPVITCDNIIEKMSTLNEELTNLTRELNKKNIELQRANETITRLSRIDAMTGLSNRGYFMEIFKKSYSYSLRREVPLSLLMADLDRFKKVNDTFGHQAGDQVLVAFGRMLQEECREEDLPARFGGEEFIILLPHTELEEAAVLGERLRSKMEGKRLPGMDIKITASFGAAQLNKGDTMDSLLQRLDQALYRAKEKGRNRVVRG